jgi:Bacterial Ig-like domain (group 2).
MRILSTVLTGVALALTACGGTDSTAPGQQPVPPSITLTITTDPIASGTSAQASATITDGSGNTSPASGVTWSSSVPSVASVNASGLVTGSLVGLTTIQATSGGLTGYRSVTVKAGAPASVSIYSGDNQIGNHGSQLPDPDRVLVKDAAGNVVPGVAASYSVAIGGGVLGAPTSPSTDALGVAISGLWSLGSLIGQQTIVASVGLAGSVTFKATAQ